MTEPEADMRTEVHTFLFADLAGFTALTEAHGDDACAELAERFVGSVERLLPADRGQMVKTIGDEVMIRTKSAADAIELGRRIVDELAVHLSPPVRVGVHSGPAVAKGDDWFGGTVNLASRVSAAARPGEVLVTDATRAELDPPDADGLTPRGNRYFKGVREPVALFTAARVGGGDHPLEVDPVCRMAVDPSKAEDSDDHRGRSYYFCSPRCASAFVASPNRFIAQGRRARLARAAFRTHLRVFLIVQTILVAAWALAFASGGPSFPWFLLVLAGWGTPLALHYRAVRPVL